MARSSSMKNVMRLIQITKEELSPEQDFLNDLKRSIELDEDKNSRPISQTYKPSSMNCIRQSYYQIRGFEADKGSTNYVNVGICNSGSDIHERVQGYVDGMIKNHMECEYIDVGKFIKSRKLSDIEVRSKIGFETKLYNKQLNMSFMCDGIIKYKGHYYILEIKTETASKFFVRKEVDSSHYHQATAYSISLGIDDVIFLYISRDTLDMKTFLFKPTDEMKHDLIGYIDECDGYVALQVTPPKPDDVAKKTCSYCIYKTQCRKDG